MDASKTTVRKLHMLADKLSKKKKANNKKGGKKLIVDSSRTRWRVQELYEIYS